MSADVVLIPISSYEQSEVDRAVRKGLQLLGGIEHFVSPEERILLKPNLLTGALPQMAVTTHPSVFRAVASLLKESGYAHLSYGDSPGSLLTNPVKASEVAGIAEAADELGVERADFDHGTSVSFPEGKVAHSFQLCDGVRQADAIINLCKMKTHALERITGGIKNMYGCIWGLNKAAGHAAHSSSESFAAMLADLNLCLKPRLHIMDGIMAMEGNGPTSGTPTAMNVLLFSADPVAMDTVFCRLINLDPESVPTNVAAAAAGVGTMTDIRVLTPDGEITPEEAGIRFGNPSFDVSRSKLKKSFALKLVPLIPFLQPRPHVDRSRCVACGLCERSCPVPEKAVHAGNGQKARYDYKRCIRCFCCQEMCPAKAISVRRWQL